MNLINIKHERPFDNFCQLLLDLPSVIDRLYGEKHNNFRTLYGTFPKCQESMYNIRVFYKPLLQEYQNGKIALIRNARLAELLDREDKLLDRFKEGSLIINIDSQIEYVNNLWKLLEPYIEYGEIDAFCETQMNLLLDITDFLFSFLDILSYIHPEMRSLVRLLNDIGAGLCALKAELAYH